LEKPEPYEWSLEQIREDVAKVRLPELEISWLRIAIFGLGVLAVISLGFILLPHATIRLPLQQRIQSQNINLIVDPHITAVSVSGEIPAARYEKTIHVSGSTISSGSTNLPCGYASGEVVFTNISPMAVSIPAGTIVESGKDSNIRFETIQSVRLQPGQTTKKSVPIVALGAGSKYNIPTGELTAVIGLLEGKVLVTNQAVIQGGYEKQVPSPVEADYENLRSHLLSNAKDSAYEEFAGSLSPEEMLLKGTLSSGVVISEEKSTEIGSAADQLTLSIDVKFEVLTCRKNDIYTTSQNYLNASVPAGWMTKDKSLFVDDINTFTERYLSEGRYQLEFRAAQILIPTVDQPTSFNQYWENRRQVRSRY